MFVAARDRAQVLVRELMDFETGFGVGVSGLAHSFIHPSSVALRPHWCRTSWRTVIRFTRRNPNPTFPDGHHRRPCQKDTPRDERHSEIATTRQGWQRIKDDADNATLALWMETITMSVTRACLAASAVLCFAIDPAAAQYNIFGTLTDVIVNGQPESPASVRQFEQRCQVRMEAGEWWLDLNTGHLGRVGGPAIYNANTCQSLVNNAAPERRNRPEGHCSFFNGGSICSGPGWGTVN